MIPFPVEDAAALLRDPHPGVQSAARTSLAAAFRSSDASSLGALLWELAGTDCYEALPFVVPLLGRGHPVLKRLALVAIKGIYPLSGLPSRTGSATSAISAIVGGSGGDVMTEWLAPRPHFARAIAGAVGCRDESWGRLIAALAELPGEHEAIAHALRLAAGDSCEAEYRRRFRARHAGRTPVQLIVALTYRCDRKCPYCYAYESQASHTEDIDLEAGLRCLDWAKRQSAEQISFTGGEPTCHPHFDRLVAAVGERGMRLYLNTNGLFGETARRALESRHVLNVGLHVSERRLHRKGEIERILSNGRSLLGSGINVFVRHTLWRGGEGDIEWVIGFCRELGVRHLNLALGFPGGTATNRFLPAARFSDVKPTLMKAFDLAARSGIRIRASKPIPLCLFTPAEFARAQRSHELASTCTVHERGTAHNLVVNPDLSTYPCVGLPVAGPNLLESDDYAPLEAHCSKQVQRALLAVQSGCGRCAIRSSGACQAACLGHCHEVHEVRDVRQGDRDARVSEAHP